MGGAEEAEAEGRAFPAQFHSSGVRKAPLIHAKPCRPPLTRTRRQSDRARELLLYHLPKDAPAQRVSGSIQVQNPREARKRRKVIPLPTDVLPIRNRGENPATSVPVFEQRRRLLALLPVHPRLYRPGPVELPPPSR